MLAVAGVRCSSRPTGTTSLYILALVCSACTITAPARTCGPADGTPSVMNRNGGRWESTNRRATLEELWRVGGQRPGEELAFPIGVVASTDGRLAVPDFQLGEVIVINRDGTWLGPWTRRGRGPGEVTRPVAAVWDTSGTLVVFDIAGPKAVFLTTAGAGREDLRMDPSFTAPLVNAGSLPWVGIEPDGSGLAQTQPVQWMPGAPTWRTTLIRLGAGRSIVDTLAAGFARVLANKDVPDLLVPGSPRLSASVAPDGTIAVGGLTPSYTIQFYSPDGRLTRRVCRDAEPLPLADDERRLPEGVTIPRSVAEQMASVQEPDTLAAVGRLFLGAHGRLWVARDRPAPFSDDILLGVPGARWDVFDPTGIFLGEVTAPQDVRLQAAVGDTVFATLTDSLDVVTIVAYQVVISPER